MIHCCTLSSLAWRNISPWHHDDEMFPQDTHLFKLSCKPRSALLLACSRDLFWPTTGEYLSLSQFLNLRINVQYKNICFLTQRHYYADYTSLSPPLTAPWLQHASLNVWQTSAIGQLPITWSLTLTRLSSSLCQGKTNPSYGPLLRTCYIAIINQGEPLSGTAPLVW